MCLCVVYFFFFKQKTAYEMRISDWSSDVCSSDLSFGGSSSAVGSSLRWPWRTRWPKNARSADSRRALLRGDQPCRVRQARNSNSPARSARSEEQTSEPQSPMRKSNAVFCLKKKTNSQKNRVH